MTEKVKSSPLNLVPPESAPWKKVPTVMALQGATRACKLQQLEIRFTWTASGGWNSTIVRHKKSSKLVVMEGWLRRLMCMTSTPGSMSMMLFFSGAYSSQSQKRARLLYDEAMRDVHVDSSQPITAHLYAGKRELEFVLRKAWNWKRGNLCRQNANCGGEHFYALRRLSSFTL